MPTATGLQRIQDLRPSVQMEVLRKTALLDETLIQQLSCSRRVRLPALISQTLEELYGANFGSYAAELAHHFGEAKTSLGSEKLVKYTLIAGGSPGGPGYRSLRDCGRGLAVTLFAGGSAIASRNIRQMNQVMEEAAREPTRGRPTRQPAASAADSQGSPVSPCHRRQGMVHFVVQETAIANYRRDSSFLGGNQDRNAGSRGKPQQPDGFFWDAPGLHEVNSAQTGPLLPVAGGTAHSGRLSSSTEVEQQHAATLVDQIVAQV